MKYDHKKRALGLLFDIGTTEMGKVLYNELDMEYLIKEGYVILTEKKYRIMLERKELVLTVETTDKGQKLIDSLIEKQKESIKDE